MLKEKLTPEDMRQTILNLMSLSETEFVVVSEVISDLKRQAHEKTERRAQAAEMVARARQHAAELRCLPRAELFAQFQTNLQSIRAEAIANGTATDTIEETR